MRIKQWCDAKGGEFWAVERWEVRVFSRERYRMCRFDGDEKNESNEAKEMKMIRSKDIKIENEHEIMHAIVPIADEWSPRVRNEEFFTAKKNNQNKKKSSNEVVRFRIKSEE